MRNRLWKLGWMLVLGVTLSGCSTQARWVNCEQHLVPVNQPSPKTPPALKSGAP